MDEKWKVLNRKGYLKIQVAGNIKTNKEILVLEVTDEKLYMIAENVKEVGQPCFG